MQWIQDSMDTRHLFLVIFLTSHAYSGHTEDAPKAVLTLEPKSMIFFQGETVNLHCSVEGQNSRDLWYRFQKLNHVYFYDLTGWVDKSTFEFYHLTVPDSGIYRCVADQLESNNLTLTVSGNPKPKLTVEPQSLVFTGETVTLKCEMELFSGWTYKWYKRYSRTPVSEGNIYTIRGAAESHKGQYWCQGERRDRPMHSETSEITFLDIRALPAAIITIEPWKDVFTGETVTIKCAVDRFDGWTYKLYKGLSPNSNLLSESSVNTFTIRGVAQSYEGQYWCQGERRDRPTISNVSRPVTLTLRGSPAKPVLSLEHTVPILTGHHIQLICEVESSGWLFYYYKTMPNSQPIGVSEINSYSISSVKVSDGGQYWCRAGRGDPVYYTQYSDAVGINVTERPKAFVSLLQNWTQIFYGETVTLQCNIQTKTNQEWDYSWYRNEILLSGNQKLYKFSAAYWYKAKYSCRGRCKSSQMESEFSEDFNLSAIEKPKAVLKKTLQPWLDEGDSVTLSCEVKGFNTGWRFNWYKAVPYRNGLPTVTYGDKMYYLEPLSDGERGSGGSYTLSPAALRHSGVYVCRAERGEPAYHTGFSQLQPLFIKGLPSASLVIKPNRTQHFTTDFLSLSCEVQHNSTGWKLMWFTKKGEQYDCPDSWTAGPGPRCHTDYLSSSDSGVYWCQSKSGKYSQMVNITVHSGPVIIDSPTYPVTEGDPLSLRCVYRSSPTDFHANFFKDGLPLKNHTTGEMTITAVSNNDEGYYQCDNTQGMSPKAWVTVNVSVVDSGPSNMLAAIVSVVLVAILILLMMLLFYAKKSKGVNNHAATCAHQDQTNSEDLNQSLNNQGDSHLQSDTTHVYAAVGIQNGEEDEGTTDLTYAEIELKQIKDKQKINNNNGDRNSSTEIVYSEIKTVDEKELFPDKHVPSDATYAHIDVRAKKPRTKEKPQPQHGDEIYARVSLKAKKLNTKND